MAMTSIWEASRALGLELRGGGKLSCPKAWRQDWGDNGEKDLHEPWAPCGAVDLGLTPGKGQGSPTREIQTPGWEATRPPPSPLQKPLICPHSPTPLLPTRDGDSWAWVPGPLHSRGRSVRTRSPALQRAAWRREDDSPAADTCHPADYTFISQEPAPHTLSLYHGDPSGLGRPLPSDQRKGLPRGWALYEQRQWTPPFAGPRAQGSPCR